MNPEIIPLVLAGVVCAVIVFVAWDSGLFAWARRGCPDYNDEGWPAGRDLQSGWPRDTGTKVAPWHTADGDAEGEAALDAHLFDGDATKHGIVSTHDGLPPHQHAYVLRRPLR